MKVKATSLGYYGNKRRKEGDIFDLSSEKHFSERWMVKVKKGSKVPEPEPEPEEEDNAEDGQAGSDDDEVI